LRASSRFEVLCTSMLVNVLAFDTVADVGGRKWRTVAGLHMYIGEIDMNGCVAGALH
jgi:hypothetical protein